MASKDLSGIYKIENLLNGKIYIGSSIHLLNRWRQHKYDLLNNKHSCTKLQHSVNKYGIESFKFTVLFYCDAKDLLFYEQRTIDKYDSFKLGYNCKPLAHSNLGLKRSKESKLKMSLAKLGKSCKPMSEETKQKIKQSNSGKVRSMETKNKLSQSKKAYWASIRTIKEEANER